MSLVKLVLLGPEASGKTSLVNQYFKKDPFSSEHNATIGVSFASAQDEETGLQLQCWDTAGNERFRTIITSYLKDAAGILFTLDASDVDGIDKTQEMIDTVKQHLEEGVAIFVVLTKMDARHPDVSDAEIGDIMASLREIPKVAETQLFYTSAKNHDRIDELFHDIAATLKRRAKSAPSDDLPADQPRDDRLGSKSSFFSPRAKVMLTAGVAAGVTMLAILQGWVSLVVAGGIACAAAALALLVVAVKAGINRYQSRQTYLSV